MNCISVLNSPIPQLQTSKLLRSATLLCAVLQLFLFYLRMQSWRFDKHMKLLVCLSDLCTHSRVGFEVYHDEFWYLFLNLFPHSMLQSLVQTLWCRARSTESTSDCSCPCQHPRDRVGFHSAGSRSLTAFSKESAVSCNGLLVLSVVGTSRIQVLLQLPSSFSDTIWLTWKRCLCCKIRKKKLHKNASLQFCIIFG